MNNNTTPEISTAAAHWQQFTEGLTETGLSIHARAAASNNAPDLTQVNESLLWALFSGLATLPHIDRDQPQWYPLINSVVRRFNVNADTVYSITYLHGAGSYRIAGRRGSVFMVNLQLHNGDPGQEAPASLVTDINLDDCHIEADGNFEIIFSPKRPAAYTGNWFPLDPNNDKLFILARQVAYDWLNEIDAQLSILRIDKPINKSHPKPACIDKQMAEIAAYVNGSTTAMMNVIDVQHARRVPINQVQDVTTTLPTISDQAYTHGVIDIDDNTAWIAECEIPPNSKYWSVQLMDSFYNALDYTYHQTSINGHIGQIDPDGKVRIVVCKTDPLIANWLDKGDYNRVMIRFRWFGTSHPAISTKTVPLAELNEHLPPNTARLTQEQRQDALSQRAMGLQMRRRW
ncbi:MAG: DUF1214 domain-containing protein [Spongiibacteraceae bacterium]